MKRKKYDLWLAHVLFRPVSAQREAWAQAAWPAVKARPAPLPVVSFLMPMGFAFCLRISCVVLCTFNSPKFNYLS